MVLPPWLNPFQLPRLGPGKIKARLLVERQTAGRLGDAKELGMAKGRERDACSEDSGEDVSIAFTPSQNIAYGPQSTEAPVAIISPDVVSVQVTQLEL